MVAILNELGVEYSSFNILADQEVRQGRAKSEGGGGVKGSGEVLWLPAIELHCVTFSCTAL